MRARQIIFAGAAGLALFASVALAPRLFEQTATQPAPDVLVTGSTHAIPGGPEASLQASPEANALLEEDALPEAEAPAPEPVAVIDTPKSLSIERKPDRIEIVGGIFSSEERASLVEAASRAFPTAAIDAQLVQEPNLPASRQDAALLAIAALSRLAEGRAEVTDDAIRVTGRALYAQTPELLAAQLGEETPEGWTVSLDIDAPERMAASGGAQCQQQIVERLAEDQIGFASAEATLQPDAEPLLDDLAEILDECPKVAVEVAGHTDSDGSEAANRRLSQERAAAVRQALAERGVEAERLSAVGYGQAQPIAPNDTPENKARNRRIEIIVIE